MSGEGGGGGGAPKKKIEVLTGEEVSPEALSEFYRKSWDDDSTGEQVRRARAEAAASNPVEPGAPPTDVAYLVDGEVVGYLGTLPARFWDGTAERPGHWLKGFQVLPEFRNGPVGFYLLRTMNKQVGLAGSLLVAAPARKLLETVGYRHMGAVTDRLLVLRGGRLLRRLRTERIPGVPGALRTAVAAAQRLGVAAAGGALGSTALSLQRALLTRMRAGGLEAAREQPGPEEMDLLWERVRPALDGAAVRNGVHLGWRYGDDDRYGFVTVRRDGALEGVAILKLPTDATDPRLEGLRIATLSDVLFPPDRDGVGVGLLCAAARAARESGADALLAGATHGALDRALARTGFVKVGRSLHFYLRPGSDDDAFPEDLASWWVTRGDCGADLGL